MPKAEVGLSVQWRSTSFGIDDTTDLADSGRWLAGLLALIRPPAQRDGKKRAMVDAW